MCPNIYKMYFNYQCCFQNCRCMITNLVLSYLRTWLLESARVSFATKLKCIICICVIQVLGEKTLVVKKQKLKMLGGMIQRWGRSKMKSHQASRMHPGALPFESCAENSSERSGFHGVLLQLAVPVPVPVRSGCIDGVDLSLSLWPGRA
ncbi:NPC intracellular cholesterol transporter 2, partial [Frankliniella fusca]